MFGNTRKLVLQKNGRSVIGLTKGSYTDKADLTCSSFFVEPYLSLYNNSKSNLLVVLEWSAIFHSNITRKKVLLVPVILEKTIYLSLCE